MGLGTEKGGLFLLTGEGLLDKVEVEVDMAILNLESLNWT